MLFMSVITWEPGQRDAMLERRTEKGIMAPKGVKVVGEWWDTSGGRDFLLYEGDDAATLAQWNMTYSDLIKVDTTTVVEAEKLLKLLK